LDVTITPTGRIIPYLEGMYLVNARRVGIIPY
jgi:hypothetical protein